MIYFFVFEFCSPYASLWIFYDNNLLYTNRKVFPFCLCLAKHISNGAIHTLYSFKNIVKTKPQNCGKIRGVRTKKSESLNKTPWYPCAQSLASLLRDNLFREIFQEFPGHHTLHMIHLMCQDWRPPEFVIHLASPGRCYLGILNIRDNVTINIITQH